MEKNPKIVSRVIRYGLMGFIAILLILPLVMCVWIGSSATSCYEDSEAVSYARSLSQDRLERLYYDMEFYSDNPSEEMRNLWRIGDEYFPAPFDDIQATRIRPEIENIMLNGCFDQYVYLHFYGFNSNRRFHPDREIVLSWGDGKKAGNQVIWSDK